MPTDPAQELAALLEDMIVPEMRRDTTSDSNVRWLLRNLAIHNKNHPRFPEAFDLLKTLARRGFRRASTAGDGFAPVRAASTPEKYEGIDFTPPKTVADAAKKGLEYRREASPSNRGGLTTEEAGKEGIGSGVQRAVNLSNRDEVSPEVIRQMSAFFARHEKNKSIAAEHKSKPWNDKGHVAWLLWGGDPGKAWVAKVIKQMGAADEKAKTKSAAPHRGKKAKTYTRLAMFDFDGTLFRSWEATPDWWDGTPLDKGPYSFFVRPESLDEPCVPDNPPSSFWINKTVREAVRATQDRNVVTVLITGRIGVHKKRVLELLKSKGIQFDHYYFNRGMSAAKYKSVILKTLLVGYNTIDRVDIWENENEKVYDSVLRSTADALGRDLDVRIHHVQAPPKELECGPKDFGLPGPELRVASSARPPAVYGDVTSIQDLDTLENLSGPIPRWLDRDYPYVAPPGDKAAALEMEYLLQLQESPERHADLDFIYQADRDFLTLFEDLVLWLGVTALVDFDAIRRGMGDVAKLVTRMKWTYNRERPYQYALRHGITDFEPLPTETGHTPAYPSGHTIQAYWVASHLSEIAPQHRDQFMALARRISWSRCLAGVHWPSDVMFGKDVFRHIVLPAMPASIRLASASRVARRYMTADENEPTNPKLWEKAKAKAKERYDKWPSAYAVGHALAIYKDEGGGWKKKASVGKHTLPPLPYAYDALEPHISEETLRFHHDKHHKAYVDGLNKAEEQIAEAHEDEDWDAIPAFNALQEFNSGGHVLHTLYWPSLIPTAEYKDPSPSLVGAIEADFGSWDAFRAQMKESTIKVRGSGWGVLVLTPAGLRVVTVMNHENGVLWDGVALLPIDAWEHAYYLDYQNDRSAHFDAVFDHLVNWSEVERRLDVARQGLRKQAFLSGVQETGGIKVLPQGKWQIVSWSELSDYMKGSVWDIYDVSYGSIGKHVPDMAGFGQKYEYLYLVDVDDDIRPDAFIAYKDTPAGFKIALGGTDGTRKAKKAMIQKMLGLIRQPGWYAEASHKVADILESAGMRPIDDEEVVRKTLRGKKIEWLGDGKYSRQLGKSSISAAKSLYGTPKVARATKQAGWWQSESGVIGDGPADVMQDAVDDIRSMYRDHPEIDREPTLSELWDTLGFVTGPDVASGEIKRARGKAKKDVGHGGLDEWFSGHGGAKGKGEDATWGDWVAISPVEKTLESGKKVKPGDIVGPCGISDDPDWKDLTDGGKDPLKCMPREKAYDTPKGERADLAKAKQRAEKKDRGEGQSTTKTPTFDKEQDQGSKEARIRRINAKRESMAQVRALWGPLYE